MEEIYHALGPETNMILWNTYFRELYDPGKETETGKHAHCVMMTVGRRIKDEKDIDKNAIRVLPQSVQKSILEKYTSETLLKVPMSWKDKIQNAIMESVRKINKVLMKTAGITITAEEGGSLEIFEYMKFRKSEEILPILYGVCFGLGVLCHMDKLKPTELMEMRKTAELKMGKFFMLGYDRAKNEGWR